MDFLLVVYFFWAITIIIDIAIVTLLFGTKYKKIPGRVYLQLIIICITFIAFYSVTTSNWLAHVYTDYHFLLYPLKQVAFLIGPFILFFTNKTLSSSYKINKINFLHFLPFAISILLTIYELRFSGVKIMWMSRWFLPLAITMHLSAVVYSSFSIYLLKKEGYFVPLISKQLNAKTNRFIAPFLLFNLFYWSYYFGINIFFINFDLSDIPTEVIAFVIIQSALPIALCIFLFSMIRNPEIIITQQPKISNYIENKDHSEHLKLLTQKLEVEKVYKDPDISLSILSKELKINPRYLSTIINSNYNVGFAELISNHRLAESKKLLIDYSDLTIQEIMFDVGFNSKSAFYTKFKKQNGLTPKEFRGKFKVLEN